MEEITLRASREADDKTLRVPKGQKLLDSLRWMGFSIRALCGERGVCGSCRIKVIDGAMDASVSDIACFSEAELHDGWRLACTAYPKEDVRVEIPSTGEEEFAGVLAFHQGGGDCPALRVEQLEMARSKDSFASQISGDGKLSLDMLQAAGKIAAKPGQPIYVAKYGGDPIRISAQQENYYAIGIDIGTTTVALALIDLHTARTNAGLTMVNRQREYGADVVTRIVKAKGGELALLSRIIRDQLAEGMGRLCQENGVLPAQVVRIAIAGNTTMLHLLLELNCDTLGSFPFTPVTLSLLTLPYGKLFAGEFDCPVDILPGISTYVGADVAAGLFYLMMHKADRPCLLLDIGTNGEMALADGRKILCTSTAAGPALEGVNIAWGTGSIPGAISAVAYGESGFSVTTIGGQQPVGICGSGVIDGVYRFLEHGIIDQSGRFQTGWAEGVVIAKTAQGEGIGMVQKDVREVQLAKSAIRSGIEILISQAGLSYGDIGTLYIAGGFGYHINFESAVGIGLVPHELGAKIKLAGNSALGGAVNYLLNPEQQGEMEEIVRLSSEFSLSEEANFQDLFVEYMSF